MFSNLELFLRPKRVSNFWTFTFTPIYSARISVENKNTDKWLWFLSQVQFAEGNDLWHELEGAAIIDIVQSSNLIIVLSIAAFF